jgi:glycine dehydrogenase subunit 2
MHPPTIYFPLIVEEALMIEPTETESLESINEYISALITIAQEAITNPEIIKTAPHTTPVKLLDEVQAARNPIVKWQKEEKKG